MRVGICEPCRKKFVAVAGWGTMERSSALPESGLPHEAYCTYCGEHCGEFPLYYVQDSSLLFYEVALATRTSMLIVRERVNERFVTAVAVAHRMVDKTGAEHSVRFDRDTQRYFIHPRWRVHQLDGRPIENDGYFGLGEWCMSVKPGDVAPPLVRVPELG